MTNISENQPVMLYQQLDRDEMIDSVGAALQEHFDDTYRVLIIDTDKSLTAVNEIIARENPQIVVAHGIAGNLAIRCDRDEDTDIIVVNPTLSDELYETPMWKFDTVYALSSVSSGESYLETIRHDFQGIRLTEIDVFSCEMNDDGIVQLIALIERVLQYRERRKKIMTFEEYDEMVRNRPTPDTPSYYSLKVWSFDKSWQWKECFSKIGDVPCYRRPVSSRQIEFATREEAFEAMNGMVESYKSEICAFIIERLPFGIIDESPLWVEAWSYDAKGNLIQEASCSAVHQYKPGIYGKFFGHLPENRKWHNGDIVQVFNRYHGDSRTYVTLGIIDGEPDGTDEGYESYHYLVKQMIRDGKNADGWLETTEFMAVKEDEMSVVYGPLNAAWDYFDFFNPMRVLPAPDNLPEEIKAELRFWYTDALNCGK